MVYKWKWMSVLCVWLLFCLILSQPSSVFPLLLQVQLQINAPSHHEWLLWIPQLVWWKGLVPLGQDCWWHSKFLLKLMQSSSVFLNISSLVSSFSNSRMSLEEYRFTCRQSSCEVKENKWLKWDETVWGSLHLWKRRERCTAALWCITLLSLFRRSYVRVLERKLQAIDEPQIEEEQCGFHPGRRTSLISLILENC